MTVLILTHSQTCALSLSYTRINTLALWEMSNYKRCLYKTRLEDRWNFLRTREIPINVGKKDKSDINLTLPFSTFVVQLAHLSGRSLSTQKSAFWLIFSKIFLSQCCNIRQKCSFVFPLRSKLATLNPTNKQVFIRSVKMAFVGWRLASWDPFPVF